MFSEVVTALVDSTDAELHERIGDLELQRRRIEAELAAAIAVADARQLHHADAHRSMTGYLKATCNWSNLEVRRWRATAAAVSAHPRIGEEWIAGHVGSPQVQLLATTHANRRVRDQLTKFVPALLTNAEELSYDDFTTTVSRFVDLADSAGAHDARDDAITHRRARVVANGGSLDVTALGGDAISTDEMVMIHRRFCDIEFAADIAARRDRYGDDAELHDLARTASQRSFDALIRIFRQANASGDTDAAGATSVVNVIIDERSFGRMLASFGLAPNTVDGRPVDPFTGLVNGNTLLDDLTDNIDRLGDIRCETEYGTPVHPHDVMRAALAGHMRRVVVDANGHVIDHGRKQRVFTGAAREAATLLIRTCQHPGCDLPTDFCDVDHVAEWHEGGRTDQTNSGVLCSHHNRAKHRFRWKRRHAADGRGYTIRADGTVIVPVGARPPRFGDGEDVEDVDVQHPDEIERLTHLARQRLAAVRRQTA